MLCHRISALIGVVLASHLLLAEGFVTFPDRKELRSPDGRFVIRSVEHRAGAREFSGVFRSLVLEDTATSARRGLYNYVGRIAIAWSGSEYLIATDYVGKRTSRALVFRMKFLDEYTVIDKTYLANRVTEDLRAQLELNDHVFVEAFGVEKRDLMLRVWGYGAHNPNGFRVQCTYDLINGNTSCRENPGSSKK